METKLVVFKNREIRRTLLDNEWYFAVVDVVAALTDSNKPRDYWYRMKKIEAVSSGFELSTICRLIKGTNNDCSDYIKGKDKVEDAELTKGWGQIVIPLLLETAGGKQNVKGTRQIMVNSGLCENFTWPTQK